MAGRVLVSLLSLLVALLSLSLISSIFINWYLMTPYNVSNGHDSVPLVTSSEELKAGRHPDPRGVTDIGCSPSVPCEYPEVVDLRVIVLTFNRHKSLVKLLRTLDDLLLDGDSASLEIWIDRDKNGGVDEQTEEVARMFRWPHGPVRVHIPSEHVGIHGQWIDTWRPRENTTEIALLLEDDISVSKFAYKWLKASRAHFHRRPDISGYTLQSEDVNIARNTGHFKYEISIPRKNIVFLYRLIGSWGFAPHPITWRAFQDWYHVTCRNQSFHPYVKGLSMTRWFRSFEKHHLEDTMWTMWYIYYANEHRLYTVYNNLRAHLRSQMSRLAVHREEAGLHHHGKHTRNATNLLDHWDSSYVDFPHKMTRVDYTGHPTVVLIK